MPTRPFRGKAKRDRFMEPAEFRELLAAARGDPDARRIFLTMGLGGLRTVEVTWLKVESLDRKQGGLWVRTAKRRKPSVDFVALDEETFRALEEGARGRADGDPLVLYRGRPVTRRQIRYLFHKYKRLAGIREALGPHSLRHLQGIALTEAGAMPQEVANRLRHSNLSQVLVYANLRTERNQALARDAASKLLPAEGDGGRVTKGRK